MGLIADVCDKGVGSALFMALFQSDSGLSGQTHLSGWSYLGENQNAAPSTPTRKF